MTAAFHRIVTLIALASIAACGQTNPPAATVSRQPFAITRFAPSGINFQSPALISRNSNTGYLEYWPLSPKGGQPPRTLLKTIFDVNAMAADKGTLLMADPNPQQVILFNLYTGHEDTLADPYGTPIDIAVDKSENIYVANFTSLKVGNVTMFPAKTRRPQKLSCALYSSAFGIAVNNEGNVIVDGINANGDEAIYEIASGGGCSLLDVPVPNGVSGLSIDPATDDLLVLDDPDECAGGLEGRLRIFPKPYDKSNHRTIVLGGNCPGGLFLNADSSVILENDADVSGSFTFIRQFSYPKGYRLGNYSGGDPGAFVTIPNSLPN